MEVSVKDGFLYVKAKLQEPKLSKSGKTYVVASSGRSRRFASVLVNGKPISISLNCWIKPDIAVDAVRATLPAVTEDHAALAAWL